MSTLLWKPTLAATLPTGYDLAALPYPLLASPKLDGVRAMVQRGVLVSRNGLPISNLQAQLKFGRAELEGLDGELTVGPPCGEDVFNRTVRVTQKRDADASGLQFNVFDRVDVAEMELSFVGRNAALKATGFPRSVNVVKQTLIKTAEQLVKYEQAQLVKGYEGCMLRSTSFMAGYPQKRSTFYEFALVKMKRRERATAHVLAIYALEHNLNQEKTGTGRRSSKKTSIIKDKTRIGSALLKDTKTGVEFTASVSGNVLQNWKGWQNKKVWIGKTVVYQYQLYGTINAVPRFPVCKFTELIGA